MLLPSVKSLLDECPLWFAASRRKKDLVEGEARVPGTPWAAGGLSLRITGSSHPTVGELNPGAALPARCPERHIQGDQTFCTGLRRLEVNTPEGARQWWEQLRQYLKCQGVAETMGIWPPHHALDHGTAGVFHERALTIAADLGIGEEYAAAWMDEPSWITDPNLRLFDKNEQPINGRAPCPRGCRVRGRPSRAIVRRKCDRRTKLLDLVLAERRRREALADYWNEVIAAGTRCCGTIKTCPLKGSNA